MIILSQDKKKIVNMDNVINIFVGYADNNKKRSVRYEASNETYEDLGIYKTEVRAKEVLQDIAARYSLSIMANNPKFGLLLEKASDYAPVFEMPKE